MEVILCGPVHKEPALPVGHRSMTALRRHTRACSACARLLTGLLSLLMLLPISSSEPFCKAETAWHCFLKEETEVTEAIAIDFKV